MIEAIGIARVERRRGVVLDRADLRTDADGAHEGVVGPDTLLQVHDELAAAFVGGDELVPVIGLRDADPTSAVVRLHEERVADLIAHLFQVEELGIARERLLEIRRVLVLLRRNEPRLGDRHAQAHHRRVRGQLLHRLDRPRVVEHVEVVEQDRLLDPLARIGVPVRQAVENDVVATLGAQVEGLDRDAIDLEANLFATDLQRRIPAPEDVLVALRPAEVRAEGEADASDGGHGGQSSGKG